MARKLFVKLMNQKGLMKKKMFQIVHGPSWDLNDSTAVELLRSSFIILLRVDLQV